MPEFGFNPNEFYTAQELALQADFASLASYNARSIEDMHPNGVIDRQDIELTPFGYSGECPEVANLLQAQMVKSFGVETQLEIHKKGKEELDSNATVFEFSDVHVAFRQVDTAYGSRYFVAKYPTPTDNNAKATGQIKSLSVVNKEGYEKLLARYREDEVKSFLKTHLGLSPDTMDSLEMSLEDMQAIAKSYVEISKLEEHDRTKLPEMPKIDKLRKRALRSVKGVSFVGLMFGEDVVDEAVDDYVKYIEASGVGVNDDVYEHIIRLEQAKRLKAMQDRIERRVRVADAGHVIKTVGLTALMGTTGYGLGLLYDSDTRINQVVEQGFQSSNAWKAAIGLGALQLVTSLASVRKYMLHRSLIKAQPMTREAFDPNLTIEDQIYQEALAFSINMRLSKVRH